MAILPVTIFAQQNLFPGCNFVLEDSACRSFLELSEAKAESVVKAADYTGQYHNYGIHVFYSSTLKSVTFYGTKPHSEYRRSFDGKPSKNFNWGDSADSVIGKFRQPTSQKTWKTGDNSVTDFYYGENIVLEFKSGKLVSVTLTSRSTDLGPNTASASQSNGVSESLYKQMNAEFDAQKFPEVIETATKFLSLPVKEQIDRVIAFNVRASSIGSVYYDNSKPIDYDYTFRYSPKTVEMLRLAISDTGEVINYYRKKTSKTANDEDELSGKHADSALLYLSLGQYSSHNPADFAKAEELYKLALPKSKKQQWLNMKLVLCLAGQYKFYEARDLAKRVLAAETEKDYIVTLSFIIEAFDSMGEYQFADAFLLEQAGIRKVANKSLTLMRAVKARREDAQKASIGFANPMTVMELNRKGALLAITQQCDKALPLFEKSMGISENTTAARFAIQCLMGKKDYESVWQTSNAMVDLNKNDVGALSIRAMLLMMQEGEAKAQADKAEADLSKAISVFPELAAMFNALDNVKKIYQFQNKPNKVNEITALEKKLGDINGEIAKEIEKENNEERSTEALKAYLEEKTKTTQSSEYGDLDFETLATRFLEDAIKPAALSFNSFTEGDSESDKDGIKTYDLSFETLIVPSTETITLFYGYKPGTKKIIKIQFSSSFDENAILKSINRIGEKYKKNGSDSKVIKKTIDNKPAYDLEINKITRIRFTPETKTLLIYSN